MKMKFLSLALSIDMVAAAVAQIPVTVNRSTIQNGGSVSLPSFSGPTSAGPAETADLTYTYSSGNFTASPDTIAIATGSVSGSPSTLSGSSYYSIFISAAPAVIFVTNAPSAFTNTLVANAGWHAIDHGGNWTGIGGSISQTYAFTVVDDGGGGGASAPSATLTGQSDPMESISRQDASTVVRKLLGFQLAASTNATLTGFAVAIYNTTTNGNPVDPIGFYRAAESNQVFDASATLLATTTNAGGYAIFDGLAESITTTNQTYFIGGSFLATNQTRNSFISATLNSQNITVMLNSQNVAAMMAVNNAAMTAMIVNGGSILGKQYAFLDTTVAEDAAYALALTNGFVSASVTNGLLNASSTNGLVSTAYLSSALAGVSNTSTSTSVKSTSFTDSILPAAAAGAAAIGAAFSSDSLKINELSKDYTPVR